MTGAASSPNPADDVRRVMDDLAGERQASVQILAERAGRVVARMSSDDGTVLVKVDAARGAFNKEVEAMSRLRALGLPVSEVRTIESGPPAVLIATWAEGVPISTESSQAVLVQVGRYLRTIHRQPAGPPFSGHPSIRAWIEAWLRSLVAWWLDTGEAPDDANVMVDRWIASIATILDARRGSLILFDGRPDHFLVDPGGTVRMIDVADAMSGEPAMDLAVLELGSPGILEPVLRGYQPDAGERSAFDALIPLLIFLRALASAEWHDRMTLDAVASANCLALARTLLERFVAGTDSRTGSETEGHLGQAIVTPVNDAP